MNRCEYAPEYTVIESTIVGENDDTYVTYGLSCRRKDFFGGRDHVKVIEDLSTDKELLSDVSDLLNMYCLPMDYFKSAVIDLLS